MGTKPTGTPNDLATRAAAEVRAELAYRGLPVKALDGVLGSHTYVHARLSAEKATIPLNLNDLVKIAEFFGWSVLELIERAQVPRSGRNAPSRAAVTGFTGEDQAQLDDLLAQQKRRVTKTTKSGTPTVDD